MSELKKRLATHRRAFFQSESLDDQLITFQNCAISEFCREVLNRVDSQRIGMPEAVRDTLKELGIEL